MKILLALCFWSGAVSAFFYESRVPAAALTPQSGVDGKIAYQVFSRGPGHRIARCALVHGYGVTQQVMGMVSAADNPLKALGRDEGLQFGLGFVNPELARRLTRLTQIDGTDAFAYFYFGEYLLSKLVTETCDAVFVPIQESTQTSVLEMTVRTELFLRDIVCKGPVASGQLGCALVGHSKGGAVATSIVRRCAEGRVALPGNLYFRGGSHLGEQGCGQLSEVYASAGSNEGEILPIMMAGSRGLEEKKKQAEKFRVGVLDFSKQFDEGIQKIKKLKDLEKEYQVDIFGPKTPTTNPYWYDLSPIAEVDGLGEADRVVGIPIGVRHGADFVLRKGGWLRDIEYAALGGNFRFNQINYIFIDEDGLKRPRFDPENTVALTIGHLPAIPARPLFLPNGGGPRLRADPERVARLEKTRKKLDFAWEPFIESQKMVDEILQVQIAEAHGNPQIALTLQWGVQDLTAFGKAIKLTDARGRMDFLGRFKLAPAAADEDGIFFQESDGLTERGAALGVCYRGLRAPAAVRIAASCATLPTTHHMGLSGMAIEVADHIVRQLSGRQL